jgi:hypothetical protein
MSKTQVFGTDNNLLNTDESAITNIVCRGIFSGFAR